MFDLAFAWGVDPDAMFKKSLSRIALYIDQTDRIAEEQEAKNHG